MNTTRLARAIALLKKNHLDAFIVSKPSNIRYLSGYSGSNGLLVLSLQKTYFLTDFRYTVQARKEVKNCQVIIAERELLNELVHLPCLKDVLKVGFDPAHMTVKTLDKIKELLPKSRLIAIEQMVESLSVVKDAAEINKIKKASKIADAVFRQILRRIKPGVREKDLALEMSNRMIKLGAEGPSFDTIIASGQRSSMPHGRASERKFARGDLITLDFGCFCDGYASDLTRTVVLGKATPKQKKIYAIVLKAQEAAIAEAKAGMSAKELDMIARDIINKEGYGDYFGHGLGHGLGLEIHDNPVVSPRSNDVLAAGNVITIEPGIYIPNWGGVRIEDDVLIANGGCKVLTRSPKELIEL